MCPATSNDERLDAEARRNRRKLDHAEAKQKRNERFSNRIYGVVHEPVIPRGVIGIWEPPSYLSSRRTAHHSASFMRDGVDRKLDLRCFYTGVLCDMPLANPPPGWNMDPKLLPWMGTRDHIVPARRDVPNCPINLSNHRTTLVWTSHMTNVVLGLVPMLVRLKIRNWLMTIPFDRNDRSVESGHNIKWLLIKLLEEFRIDGRYPWSRNYHGNPWCPAIHEPFMRRMYEAELAFLTMDENDRDQYIRTFNWRF